ncbi:DUF6064 family protein [Roseovarius aestuariivivens]|uniref:DUF6064 family protein n=1 Tax=Roseovarius aestuariivivens TaxID=1888910 RepID=UPI0010811E96|nr:DUF6064 family protein [Roseovarius aestuariivivens]
MADWLSYRASDFLLFSERVYWRLFERLNEAIWLWPLAATTAVLAGLVLLYRRPRHAQRAMLVLLSVSWAASGLLFVWQIYAPVHLGMPYLAPFFAVEAVLLLCAAAARTETWFSRTGLLLISGACLWPVLAPVFGRPFVQAEVFGTAPDPVAVATLGLALCLRSARWRFGLMLIPALWLLQSAVTLWVLSGWAALPPAAAVAVALVGALWRTKARQPA